MPIKKPTTQHNHQNHFPNDWMLTWVQNKQIPWPGKIQRSQCFCHSWPKPCWSSMISHIFSTHLLTINFIELLKFMPLAFNQSSSFWHSLNEYPQSFSKNLYSKQINKSCFDKTGRQSCTTAFPQAFHVLHKSDKLLQNAPAPHCQHICPIDLVYDSHLY